MNTKTEADSHAVAGQVERRVRPVAEVCAGSLRWHIPMPDHAPNVAYLSGVHYLYDRAALDGERERIALLCIERAALSWAAADATPFDADRAKYEAEAACLESLAAELRA